ncbi:hypothetical protein DL89DRAFT_119360 [Linderina pennispora]|uniref:Uncharacterized protein n=1 Tax=Linderina pennispora TaxID=61395 RepID=A0A1Y1VVD7_9FUNG|nr:uncharacterized protein DL89DRAFT_119360 [Linderina pennispora]ORX65258.1 hypothetical protein DL89DRAFT_119360 [Linderina pennispora]
MECVRLAQLAERESHNLKVVSSSLTSGTVFCFCGASLFGYTGAFLHAGRDNVSRIRWWQAGRQQEPRYSLHYGEVNQPYLYGV